MDSKIVRILVYLVIGFVAVVFGIPLLFKLVALGFKLIGITFL